jgi:type IV pilus assembly protein PilV
MRSYQKHTGDMEKRVRNLRKEKGFTLIEVLIAITILAFGLLAVASMQTGAIQGNLFASGKTEAVTWAQDRMESLLALPYAQVVPGAGGPVVQVQEGSRRKYTITWNVGDNNPINGCKLIEVWVNYQERGIVRRTVQLTSIKPQV